MTPRENLPRRAFLGVALPPDVEAFAEGMKIASVLPNGMADDAGVMPHDVITKIAGLPVRSLLELSAALRAAGHQDRVHLAVERGSKTMQLTASFVPCPYETIEGQEVAYEHVDSGGARLRSIVTVPQATTLRGSVLLLQGIACESVDYGADATSPLAQLVHDWARAGFATMRVDKRGVGDSGGQSCRDADFETELSDHRAALNSFLCDQRFTDGARFVFGHSVGGMVAAVLANERAIDGLIVYGTSPAKWLTCMEDTTRRQLVLANASADSIEEAISDLRRLAATEGLNGRSAAYHCQLDALDLEAAWRGIDVPVLVVRGQHDWVVGADEQQRIVDIVNEHRSRLATLVDVEGLDHVLGWHASRADSLRDYGAGAVAPDISKRTIEWMAQAALQSHS